MFDILQNKIFVLFDDTIIFKKAFVEVKIFRSFIPRSFIAVNLFPFKFKYFIQIIICCLITLYIQSKQIFFSYAENFLLLVISYV